MLHVRTDDQGGVTQFVQHGLGARPDPFRDPYSFGVYDGPRLLAGVVFSEYRALAFGDVVEGSIYASSPAWCHKRILRDLFSYPFHILGVVRLEVRVRDGNRHSRDFVKRLGFCEEGRLRRGWDGKEDVLWYSMFKEECKWI